MKVLVSLDQILTISSNRAKSLKWLSHPMQIVFNYYVKLLVRKCTMKKSKKVKRFSAKPKNDERK